MFQRLLILFAFAAYSLVCHCQSFQKLPTSTGINHAYVGLNGAGGSFYDWDKDGYADISLCVNGAAPQFYHNLGDSFEPVAIPFIENTGNIKSISWVDFDNDGDADISVNRESGPFEIFENDGNFNFSNISADLGLPVTSHYGYGHSWGDYDRDGFLDLYICNYHYYEAIPNYLFKNNGDGSFTEVGALAGVDDGYNYSFQAVWCDFNFDGWQDLYVINDKISANHLYLNNGDGTFTNISVSSGSDVIIEAMSNSIADYDNDGDWDIYITNAIDSNVLLRANSTTNFCDHTVLAGVEVEEMCWGSLFFDYDNNGWNDLLVSTIGVPNELYTNQMDGGFLRSYPAFLSGPSMTHGLMEADFNQDGKADFISIDRPPSLSTVWRNTTASTNNYFVIGLEGVISNRDAIGARIELYSGELMQRKQVCSSENYLTQNSQYLHFGLGESESIDSLLVAWPSGWTEKLYNIPVNQKLILIEGESLAIDLSLADGSTFCEGDNLVLSATGWSNYTWNTGDESQSIVIEESGYYQVQSLHDSGILVYSDSIFIEEVPLPEVVAEIQEISCHNLSDGAISLSPSDQESVLEIEWNNGLQQAALNELLYGVYTAQIVDEHGCENEWSYELINPSPLAFSVHTSAISCYGGSDGSILLDEVSGEGPFHFLWSNLDESQNLTDLEAGLYSVIVNNDNDCGWAWVGLVVEPDPIEMEIALEQISCFGASDGSLVVLDASEQGPFDIFLDGIIANDTISNLEEGVYSILAINENQCTWENQFEIISPEELIVEYSIVDQFGEELGGIEFEISGGSPPYTIMLDGIPASLLINDLQSGEYQVNIYDGNECTWEEILSVTYYVGIDEMKILAPLLYPNPTKNSFKLKNLPSNVSKLVYLILDNQGRAIIHGNFNGSDEIDCSDLVQGIYTFTIPSLSFSSKLMVQH